MDTFQAINTRRAIKHFDAGLIKLPDDHAIGFIITVGKATKGSWPKPGQLPLEEVIVENHF